jgi:hypothetical protein
MSKIFNPKSNQRRKRRFRMKYKRVVITRHGGPEVLQVVEDELLEPQSGHLRGAMHIRGIRARMVGKENTGNRSKNECVQF